MWKFKYDSIYEEPVNDLDIADIVVNKLSTDNNIDTVCWDINACSKAIIEKNEKMKIFFEMFLDLFWIKLFLIIFITKI